MRLDGHRDILSTENLKCQLGPIMSKTTQYSDLLAIELIMLRFISDNISDVYLVL